MYTRTTKNNKKFNFFFDSSLSQKLSRSSLIHTTILCPGMQTTQQLRDLCIAIVIWIRSCETHSFILLLVVLGGSDVRVSIGVGRFPPPTFLKRNYFVRISGTSAIEPPSGVMECGVHLRHNVIHMWFPRRFGMGWILVDNEKKNFLKELRCLTTSPTLIVKTVRVNEADIFGLNVNCSAIALSAATALSGCNRCS